MANTNLNPSEVILSNSGYLKINGVELAELKNIEITMSPEVKSLAVMNSPSKAEIATGYTGNISFGINKVYSRFKPALLEAAKELRPFNFTLECVTYSADKNNQEAIYIDNCWFKGDIQLMALNAEGDFITETYEAGFGIESAEYTDILDDGNSW